MASLGEVFFRGLSSVTKSRGRRGVAIFGWTSNESLLIGGLWFFYGIPFVVILAMMPFWDRVGDFWWLKTLNSYVAPAVGSLSYDYRSSALPSFPLKRFLIAATSLVELLILAQFAALAFRKARKHALLVWICFDRTKLFQYFLISAVIFFGLWYIFFFDWRILSAVNNVGSRAGRIDFYLIMSLPVVTLIFGHLAAIIGLGALRSASKMFRRFCRGVVSKPIASN